MEKRLISLIVASLILTMPICFSSEIAKPLSYDANGNLIDDGEYLYSYNLLPPVGLYLLSGLPCLDSGLISYLTFLCYFLIFIYFFYFYFFINKKLH